MVVVMLYLTLMTKDAPQRQHALRELFNGLSLPDPLRHSLGRDHERSATLVRSLSAVAALACGRVFESLA